MSYCTLAQLTARYSEQLLIEISDRAATPTGVVDEDLIDRAIADADALIDGYLASRYALPLASVPALVTDLSQRIAIYYAHASVAADKIAADYKEALRQLQDIAKGLLTLDVAGVEPEGADGGQVVTNEPERPFNAANMKGWI